jgi:hypothetical protein
VARGAPSAPRAFGVSAVATDAVVVFLVVIVVVVLLLVAIP